MKKDCAFTMGVGHAVCEDYATCGCVPNTLYGHIHYAIVSDGCSGSQDTDVGARILSRAAINVIKDFGHTDNLTYEAVRESFRKWLVEEIRKFQVILHLPKNMLEATLLVAVALQDKRWIFGWGDGVIVLKHKDGNLECTQIMYTPNYPAYLSYHFYDPSEFVSMVHTVQETTFNIPDCQKSIIKTLPVKLGQFDDYQYSADVSNLDLSHIVLMSDGIESFSQNGETLDVKGQIKKYTDFKNSNLAFAQRRMQRMAIENKAAGITHYDDLSMAVISL